MWKFRLGLLLGLFVLGCDAKRVEPPVKVVDGAGATLEESKTFTTSIDKRINEMVGGLAGLNSKLKMVLRLTQGVSSGSGDNYTPLDFVLDILTEAKKGVATKNGTSFEKEGFYELGFLGSDANCRFVRTFLSGKTDAENQISQAILSIQNSCLNNGTAIDVATAQWVEGTFSLTLNIYDLQTLITKQTLDIINQSLREKTGCELSNSSTGILDSAHCENIVIKISDSIVTTFDHLNYSGTGQTSLAGSGNIFENEGQKAAFDFTVPRDGNIQFNLNKTARK